MEAHAKNARQARKLGRVIYDIHGMANVMGIHPATLYRWIRGESVPRAKMAARIEFYTGVKAKGWVR